MKKTLILLLSVMVVLAFAASAFALHQVTSSEYTPGLVKAGKAQIELGGEIRVRGNLSKNTDFNDDTEDTSQSYDQRVRLRTKANVTDKTMGVVELEAKAGSSSSYTWGSGTESKRDAMYIRQAYISHQFGTIGGIKAGHMLLGLGNRLFFDHTNYGDDALIGWVAVGPGELSLIDIKVAEGDTKDDRSVTITHPVKDFNMDDYDAYVLAIEMPINVANVSADITYLRNRDTTTYDKGLKFFNIGVRADADLKVVKVKGDVEVQRGKASKDVAGDELKFKGMAAMLGVEANVGPATIRGGAAYGTGTDEDDDADEVKEFQTLLTDNQYSTFIYDYTVAGAAADSATDLNNGLANTMYITVGASVKPIPDLKVSVDAYYLRASKEVENEVGDKTKKLGYELDGKIEYQLATNLAYYIEAGMLFAGDAYNRVEDGDEKDADNPYRVRHGLLLSF